MTSVLCMHLSPLLDVTGAYPYPVFSHADWHVVVPAQVLHLGYGSLPCDLSVAVFRHSSPVDAAVVGGGWAGLCVLDGWT